MAFQYIELGNNWVDLIEVGPSTMDDEREASAWVVAALNRGCRFVRYPHLRPGKLRFRKQRATQVLRELRSADRFGLRRLAPEELDLRRPAAGRFLRAYPDWELLDWWIQEWTMMEIEGRWIEIPNLPDGRLKATMNSREIRARMSWSQSFLEKMTAQLPGLGKEPGEFGDVQVETVEFLLAINDAKFPFMRQAKQNRRNQ
jgi:hypothetical protein